MKVVLLALHDIYSYGIRTLHALLRNNNYFTISVYFGNSVYTDKPYTGEDVDHIVEALKREQPDLIGIGVRSPLYKFAAEITDRLRNETKYPVVWGGPHVSAAPDQCIKHAQHIICGEAEMGLLSLVRRIRGTVTWNGTGKQSFQPNNNPVMDLDSVPLPAYGENEIYINVDPSWRSAKRLSVWTGRGCHFNCSYCFESTMRGLGKYKVRRRSVDKTMEWIQLLQDNFPKLEEITFSDHVFTWGKSWLEDFYKEFPKTGLTFRCFGHPAMVDRDMLRRLKQAGMAHISFGLESGANEIRKVFNRHETDEQVIQVSEWCKELEIDSRWDVIGSNPFDTPDTMRQTRDLISKLARTTTIRNFELRFFPGTRVTDLALEMGYIRENDVEGAAPCRYGDWSHNYALGE